MALAMHNPFMTFERSLPRLGQVLTDRGRVLALILDNAHELAELASSDSKHGQYLLAFLRTLVYSPHLRLFLLLGMSGDAAQHKQRFSELFALSHEAHLAPLGIADLRSLLARRAGRLMVLADAAMTALHDASGGHVGVALLLAADIAGRLRQRQHNIVTAADVAQAQKAQSEQVVNAYQVLWSRLCKKNRILVSLLAELPPGSTEAAVSERLHERGAPLLEQETKRLLAGLIQQGLVIKRQNGLALYAGLWRAWVASQQPFETTLSQSLDYIGPYRVVEKIGEGGMGVVFLAYDMVSQREVALKVMGTAQIGNPDARRRFLREAELGLRLRHPHIVHLLSRGEHEGNYYIAMELLRGTTVRRALKTDGPFAWPEAVRIAAAVADALVSVHALGIVHRDLKSENIMLVGEARVPKLMDFGLSHATDFSSLTRTNALVGTMPYMAPEQIEGDEPHPSWDLYSLGVVMYEMLTGKLPFGDSAAVRLLRAIVTEPPPPLPAALGAPAALGTLLSRLLAKTPETRLANASELVLCLRGLSPPPPGP
jgi:hypothetical protein